MTRSQNADPVELAKFDADAARWWDPEGPHAPLHRINRLRLGWIAERVSLEGARVVDVGCGGGLAAEAMALAGADVLGIDLAEGALAAARSHARESGLVDDASARPGDAGRLDYRALSAEELARERPAAFDLVTCLEMLEHVPDPAAVVAACARLAKPGGQVVFSTINRNPKARLLAIVVAERVLRWLPRGTHDYERFIRPSELVAWCRAVALRADDVAGIVYAPLAREFRIDARDVDVNYLLAATREDAAEEAVDGADGERA